MTMMITEEEEEVVVWCKDMVGMGHGMELIQLKSIVVQICQGGPNPFEDEFPRKSWWLGVKKGIQNLCCEQKRALIETWL